MIRFGKEMEIFIKYISENVEIKNIIMFCLTKRAVWVRTSKGLKINLSNYLLVH